MRIWNGFFAGMIWIFVVAYLIAKTEISISGDVQVLTTAIVIAGGMAGGD